MVAASYVPTKLKKSQMDGAVVIDFDSNTLKCMLVVAGGGLPSVTSGGIQYVSDITGTNAEVTGTGYSRQTLSGVTVAFDGSNDTYVDLSFSDVTFAQNAAGFTTGRYIVFYKDAGGADSGNPVFCIGDPDQTLSAVTGDVVLSVPTGGLIQWQ